ncbi:GH25 family lysozyme [Frigidibacter sp. SD6-1]|uniref:glycoside hydrolase family 25 protein n=1 Tax=Frigidibacter sp. SD6-1 TaxID=3032581 RepID=UPI0024DFB925|nr:GH25 family lysozyme [Frigidibacter sp. SD6-1]
MKSSFKTILGLAVLLALQACGGGSRHPYGIPEQFDDAKPWAWRGTVPAHYEVHGVDVSRYQGDVDWFRAAGAGVRFAFIKATEGGDLADPQFQAHWYGAAQAGIPRGAYHFYYFCRTGAEQAAWFIQHAPREAGTLPPVLDIEWTRSYNCPQRPDAEAVRAEAAAFLAIVHAYYGRTPIIYTTVDFWEENEMWRLQGYEFWLRSVAGHPSHVYDGHHWSFWQYTGTGLAPGFRGEVDLNAFAGTEADWQAWLAARVQQ